MIRITAAARARSDAYVLMLFIPRSTVVSAPKGLASSLELGDERRASVPAHEVDGDHLSVIDWEQILPRSRSRAGRR